MASFEYTQEYGKARIRCWIVRSTVTKYTQLFAQMTIRIPVNGYALNLLPKGRSINCIWLKTQMKRASLIDSHNLITKHCIHTKMAGKEITKMHANTHAEGQGSRVTLKRVQRSFGRRGQRSPGGSSKTEEAEEEEQQEAEWNDDGDS